MAGYREHRFAPWAYQQQGRPMRPFNGTQRAGVVLVVLGLGLNLYLLAGVLGLVPPAKDIASAAVFPLIIGASLMNSRRQPAVTVDRLQLQRNRRVLLVTTLVLVVVLGTVLALSAFTGA